MERIGAEEFVVEVKVEITTQLAPFRKRIGDSLGSRKTRGLEVEEEIEAILWHRKIKKIVAMEQATNWKTRYFEGQPIHSITLFGLRFDRDRMTRYTASLAADRIIKKVLNKIDPL